PYHRSLHPTTLVHSTHSSLSTRCSSHSSRFPYPTPFPSQPPPRDRALRRRGHLHRRRHPRPPVRPQLRLSGHARHRRGRPAGARDRKSTRLNSSHVSISYDVFCFKKKTTKVE